MLRSTTKINKLFCLRAFSSATAIKPWKEPMSAGDFDLMRQILAAPRYIIIWNNIK